MSIQVLMVFLLIEREVKLLLLEMITMLSSIIELEVVRLFQEQDLLELDLISLESGSQTKMLKSWFQIQHGQHTEVLPKKLVGNGKITDIMTEKLEDLTVMVCLKI